MGAQLALLFFTLSLSVYWLLIRKKKRENAEWVPAALVRAYLDRMRSDESETRFALFGEQPREMAGPIGQALAGGGSASGPVRVVADPNLLKEVEALRAQLLMADRRAQEFDAKIEDVKKEKVGLETMLAEVKSGKGIVVEGGGDSAVLQKELSDLKAKLQEYEVIEDDLANLKKYQRENDELKKKIEEFEANGGGAKAAVEEEEAPKKAKPKVAPAPAPVEDTNIIESVAQEAEAAPAEAESAASPEKDDKQKEDDLLSEFEKMLAS